jgi:hypothetical protein
VVVGSLAVEIIRVVTLLVPLVRKGRAAADAVAGSLQDERSQDGRTWR